MKFSFVRGVSSTGDFGVAMGEWWTGDETVIGDIELDAGDPLTTFFGFFVGVISDVDVGVVIGDFRWSLNELVSLMSVRSRSPSPSSSELFSASAASKDFLCMPESHVRRLKS